MYQQCDFDEPVNLGTELLPDWEFSGFDCDLPETFEFILNETTEAQFYISRTFNYGDFFVVFFLMVFTLWKIVEIIWNKFIKKQ